MQPFSSDSKADVTERPAKASAPIARKPNLALPERSAKFTAAAIMFFVLVVCPMLFFSAFGPGIPCLPILVFPAYLLAEISNKFGLPFMYGMGIFGLLQYIMIGQLLDWHAFRRAKDRSRLHFCYKCAYPLAGISAKDCPECGYPITEPEQPS